MSEAYLQLTDFPRL